MTILSSIKLLNELSDLERRIANVRNLLALYDIEYDSEEALVGLIHEVLKRQ